jgi:5-methylthioadenosine/S-adenosylhomocysteine deaminase
MTRRRETRWRFGCPCCEGGVATDRRKLLFGGAALSALSATGLLQGVTGAAAQSSASPPASAPRGNNYVLRGGYVLTLDRNLNDIPIGDVHVRDGAIVAVGPSVEAAGAEVVSATGMIVMPGFIETHSHIWNSLFKNMRRPGVEYFPLKEAFGKHHTPVDYYRAHRLFLTEATNAGITTVINYAHNTQSPAHCDAEIRAMAESGLRGRYAYGGPDPMPADQTVDFADILRIKRQWFDSGSAKLVDFGFANRAPGPSGPLQKVYAQEYRFAKDNGLPIILHAGSAPSLHISPVQLAAEGLVDKTTLFVHSVTFDEKDREVLARIGASNSFSLYNELRGSVGHRLRTQILEMTRLGINVSLSFDATSLNPVSTFEQMRLAFHLASPGAQPSESGLTQTQCLEMATINGAKAMGIADRTGSLTPGKRADLIMLRATDLNMVPLVEAHSAVVHSANTGNVDTVIVDGRVLKFGGRILSVDPETVRREAIESAYLLRQRAGGQWTPKPHERPA